MNAVVKGHFAFNPFITKMNIAGFDVELGEHVA